MSKTVVAYGAGTNSTAMLVGLHERGERPDLILFADTGGERPETYAHLQTVSKWCVFVGFPEIVVVKAPNRTLEEDCLIRGALPSVAHGFKTCSLRFKKEPQDKFLRNNNAKDAIRLIGIDAGEQHRAKPFEGTRYPLIEWDWGRDECVEAITRAGLPQPGKSACFFCPSSKPKEILELKRTHPDLLARAIAMEENAKANLTSVKGLGRNWAWGDMLRFEEAQLSLFRNDMGTPCGCYDGGEE